MRLGNRAVLCTFVGMALFCLLGTVDAAEMSVARRTLKSGPAIGKYVPSFYSRAVTGPLMNKSICYVCRNGGRPVVMILMRQIGPQFRSLLQNVGRVVDRNRASGLRGFGVLLSQDAIKATSAVQTFSFNNKISIPLTVGGEGIGAASCQNVHNDAALTVVLYRRRKVVARFAFRDGELKRADVRQLIHRIREFAGERVSTSQK